VAEGALGVAVYDVSEPLSPRLTREQSINGAVADGFTVVDGEVWGLVTSKLAMPVGDVSPTTGPILLRASPTSQRDFIYGGTSGKLVAPTGRRAYVFCQGGAGVMSYWLFGIGVGTWVIGNGTQVRCIFRCQLAPPGSAARTT